MSHEPGAREQAALAHARECPACRAVQQRYETLRRALREWNGRSIPVPAPDLVDRMLREMVLEAGSDSGRSRGWRVGMPIAVAVLAASVLVVALAPIRWTVVPGSSHQAAPAAGPAPIPAAGPGLPRSADRRGLTDALTHATAATWELARTTSAPAARLGREVLSATVWNPDEASTEAQAAPDGSSLLPIPSMLRVVPEPPDAIRIQELGDRLTTGVRPLSTTARQAFGFLRTPSLDKPRNPTGPPASKGA